MTIDGGPPPDGGYPDPKKYVPDNLGEMKVWESGGRIYVQFPTAAMRYLEVEEGDKIIFTEGDSDEKTVIAKKETNG